MEIQKYDGRTDMGTGYWVGARDTCVSKKGANLYLELAVTL